MGENTETKKKTETVEKTVTGFYQIKTISKRRLLGNFLVYFLVSLLVVILISVILFYVTGFFPDYVPISTAKDLLNIMINVDGILLGFVGIVFAQLLSSIMDQQNVLYQRILEKSGEADENMKSLEFMDARKDGLSLVAVVTFASLLLSVFVSMANIASISKYLPTDTYATFGILSGPLLLTIVAVVSLALALVVLPLKPPLEKIPNK